MPFHQRSVEPRRVSRLSAREGCRPAEETGRRRLRRPVLFSSLDDVACHTLTGVIRQLSDLSRHASDIFLGIEREAGEVFRRSCKIQGRLRSLQSEIHTLDPKKVKIREFETFFPMEMFLATPAVNYIGTWNKVYQIQASFVDGSLLKSRVTWWEETKWPLHTWICLPGLTQNDGNSGMIPATNDGSVFFSLTNLHLLKILVICFDIYSVVCFAPAGMYHLWPSTPVLNINPGFRPVYYLRPNEVSVIMLLCM